MTIVSFIRQKKYKNVICWNPVTRREKISINPQRDLEIKIITGDINDGIPSIKRGMGIKTAEKLIDSRSDLSDNSDSLLVKNYKRNRVLIDFEFIPKSIRLSIIDAYNDFKIQPIDLKTIKKIFPFFMEYGVSNAIQKWQICKDSIMRLS